MSVSDCYYMEGVGGTAQSGATMLTEKQMMKQSAFTAFDFDNIWTMNGNSDYPYPELRSFSLNGEVGISGDASYLSTLKPDLSKIEKVDDTFTYEWLVNGTVAGKDSTYTIKAADVGKKSS